MPTPERFPRVLVLCHEPINRVGGGGVTMGNLFRGWPQGSLAQVWGHHRFQIDPDVCTVHLRLGDHAVPGGKWTPTRLKRQRRFVARVLHTVRLGYHLDYDLVLSWVRAFGPNVIYSQATEYPMYSWWLPRWLSRDLAVPLVNHIMDDWPAFMLQEWPPVFRQIMALVLGRQLRALFGAGVQNLAICQQMADSFSRAYGVPFVPFHNAVDFQQWQQPRRTYETHGQGFRVVYMGALAENMQVHSLRDVAGVVSSMAQKGTGISLTIYTGEIFRDCYQQHFDGLPAVEHGGTIAREDLCTCLAAADLLILPVNFDRRSMAGARYSMPTKAPEYMASGTPVLVYSPSFMPVAQYAHQESWGYVVDERDPSLLERALSELMGSESLREQLGRRARALAERNHDAGIVRSGFQDLLCNVAGSQAVP